jgi:hypothetical protein
VGRPRDQLELALLALAALAAGVWTLLGRRRAVAAHPRLAG